MRRIGIIVLVGMLLVVGSGCGLKRSLADGEYLYTGAKVKIKKANKKTDTKALMTAYESLIKNPRPNRRFLGIRWGLRIHNLFASKKEKGLLPWLQKLGQEPVIYDEKFRTQMERLLENKAINNGFFFSEVSSELKTRGRKVKVKYEVKLRTPYTLSTYSNEVSTPVIKAKIDSLRSKSLVKVGTPYQLEVLKKERQRLASVLKQSGYYFFTEDDLKFRADTTQVKGEIQLALQLKQTVDANHLIPQRIRNIWVYPDMNVKDNQQGEPDTLDYEGLKIVARQLPLRPTTLREAITFQIGQLYSAETHQSTLQKLAFLNNHQFIDIQFFPLPGQEGLLNVVIRLTPRKRNAIEGSLGFALKSSLYFGPEITLSYLDRNLFGGAEQLRISTTLNYNIPLIDTIASNQQQELSIALTKPGLLLPFRSRLAASEAISSTKFTLTFERDQIRIPLVGIEDFLEVEGFNELLGRLQVDSTFAPAFVQNDVNFSLSYQWRKRKYTSHELTPVELNWLRPNYEVGELRDLILVLINVDNTNAGGDDQLLLNLENMLIFKPSYTLLYDGRAQARRAGNFYSRSKIGVLGNKLLSSDNLIPSELIESQFLRLEQDVRHFWKFSKDQSLGLRLAANVSIPFRDEVILPFFDLYSTGGPNSNRAFQPREVGPGSTEPTERIFFFTGTGDILIESNLEWRPKIGKSFELGLFVDAGNVWLFQGGVNNNELAKFRWNNFYKQLAVGTGLGLRYDFDILLLRLDLAFPLTKPWLPEGQRWVLDQFDLGSAAWRSENLRFNLAFGYPF
ncbi:MAG: BamA/TamA family outer membrane protein [Bacteroidota bacterium]